MKLNKKDWVCRMPFENIEIYQKKTNLCCPQWLPYDLDNPDNLEEIWDSELAKDIRKSVSDGSYRYCKEDLCPKLNGLKLGLSKGFIHKDKLADYLSEVYKNKPIRIRFNFDQSCNLKCPTCRKDTINFKGAEKNRAYQLIDKIEKEYGSDLNYIDCTGSGDPFYSSTFKKWLINFNRDKYPNLESIHLHTNATLWNESNWDKIRNVQDLIKTCEISIDAATKDTYENKTRLNGKWDVLLENLNFISTLPYLEQVYLSFVVQEANYKEMPLFYDLMKSIFNKTEKIWQVIFNRVTNWGTFTEEEFKRIDIASPNHKLYPDLLEIIYTLPTNNHILHNLPIPNIDKN